MYTITIKTTERPSPKMLHSLMKDIVGSLTISNDVKEPESVRLIGGERTFRDQGPVPHKAISPRTGVVKRKYTKRKK